MDTPRTCQHWLFYPFENSAGDVRMVAIDTDNIRVCRRCNTDMAGWSCALPSVKVKE